VGVIFIALQTVFNIDDKLLCQMRLTKKKVNIGCYLFFDKRDFKEINSFVIP